MPSAEEVARAVWEQPVDIGLADGTTQTEKAGVWLGWANKAANRAADNSDAILARLNAITSVTEPAGPALDPAAVAAIQQVAQQVQTTASDLTAFTAALGTALGKLTTTTK